MILTASYVSWFMKERMLESIRRLNIRHSNAGMAHIPEEWIVEVPSVEDETFPPRTSFKLISALHHVSGTMVFTFECSHGSTSERLPESMVTHADILDIQLLLYSEMFDCLTEKRLYWDCDYR